MHPKARLTLEQLECRTVPTAGPLTTYSIDGTGNNLANPDWGSTGIQFLRLTPAEYGDGVSSVGGTDRPSARVISNALAAQEEDTVSDRMLSAMIYAWGQFIDHDIDLTNTNGTERLSIAVPTGDPWFDPSGTGTQTINTTRSVFDAATGTDASNPRQQINAITAWLDGSMIYGSDATTAASLRTFQGGRLKTSVGNLLPTDAGGFFQAGDIRVNENPELISLQTLFVREHNRLAGNLARSNPRLTDEQLYLRARSMVIGEIQAITYNQWLPAVLGPGAIARYSGYKAGVNPGISNEFATAGFRFGHSLLGDDIEFLNNQGLPIRAEVSLSESFFNPNLVKETGIDAILKYLASDPSSELDTQVVDSVRNFLFGPPGAGGLDLASLNIQRGRDHGLADYNTTRAAYGLPRVTSFAQISSDPNVQANLAELYGTVDNIDLWVGALAENHVQGGSVGPTLRAIIGDQFTRLRDGDRFWYQKAFAGTTTLPQLESTTLTDIIKRNTTLTNLQSNTFFFKAGISGTVFVDGNRDGIFNPIERGVPGRTVELLDRSDGSVLATTLTDGQGRYQFDVADGVRTGQYQVRILTPAGPITRNAAITRGDQFPRLDLPLPPRPGGLQPLRLDSMARPGTLALDQLFASGMSLSSLRGR